MSTGPNAPSGGNQNSSNWLDKAMMIPDLAYHAPRYFLHGRGVARDAERHREYFQQLQTTLRNLIHEDQSQPDPQTVLRGSNAAENEINRIVGLIANLNTLRGEMEREIKRNKEFTKDIEEAEQSIQAAQRAIARLNAQEQTANASVQAIQAEAATNTQNQQALQALQNEANDADTALNDAKNALTSAESLLQSYQRLSSSTSVIEDQERVVEQARTDVAQAEAGLRDARQRRAQAAAQTARNGSANTAEKLRNSQKEQQEIQLNLADEGQKLAEAQAKLQDLQRQQAAATTRQQTLTTQSAQTEAQLRREVTALANLDHWNYSKENEQTTIAEDLENIATSRWSGAQFDGNESIQELDAQITQMNAVRDRMRAAHRAAQNPATETGENRSMTVTALDPVHDEPENADFALRYRRLKERFDVLFNRISQYSFFKEDQFKAPQQQQTVFQMAEDLNNEFERAIQYDRAGQAPDSVRVDNVDQLRVRVDNFVRILDTQIRHFREHMPDYNVVNEIVRDRANPIERIQETNGVMNGIGHAIGSTRDAIGFTLNDNPVVRNRIVRRLAYTAALIGGICYGASSYLASSGAGTLPTPSGSGGVSTPTGGGEVTQEILKQKTEDDLKNLLGK